MRILLPAEVQRFFFLFKNVYVFIYLFIFYLTERHVEFYSLTRERTLTPTLEAQSLNCWTGREVPKQSFDMNFLLTYRLRIQQRILKTVWNDHQLRKKCRAGEITTEQRKELTLIGRWQKKEERTEKYIKTLVRRSW